VMREDPANVDAVLGAGMTLVATGRAEEGIETLERAESLQPQNPDVLSSLGRAHALAGHTSRAVLYAERAAAVGPGVRQPLEQARLAHGHRVEITSFGEDYSTPTPRTGSVDVRLNVRLREDLRVTGRGQHQRKFGFTEQRGGGGVEWRLTPQTSWFGEVLVGPGDNAVLPQVDVSTEIAHAEGSRLWVAGYRFFDFPGVRLSVVSPGATWWPTDRLSLALRYYLAVTERSTLNGFRTDHSLATRAGYRMAPRVWVNGGYAHGTENFETLSPDRVGDFGAHTASGGVRVDFRTLTSVLGTYEHQWRPGSIEMQRLSLSLLQRF
jgi:YaiO family outer membrane protein